MAQVQHNLLTGASLHEPKGVATALSNRVYLSNGVGSGTWSQTLGTPLFHIQDIKAQNTPGGTFTSGAWQTRTLNTSVINEITGASLAANQIILPAGTYVIIASAPAYLVDAHRARIQNITDGVTLLHGATVTAAVGTGAISNALVMGRITLAATKTLELQHRCGTTNADDGFGAQSNWADELYSNVMIWKHA